MSNRRSNGNNQTTEVAQDVEYEEVEDLESEVKEAKDESDMKVPGPKDEEKKGFLSAAKSGIKKAGKVLLGVAIGVGGSLAVGYFMNREDRPAALEEGDVEYYDFEDEEETSEKEEYPGD